jgi:hypothetical protein
MFIVNYNEKEQKKYGDYRLSIKFMQVMQSRY